MRTKKIILSICAVLTFFAKDNVSLQAQTSSGSKHVSNAIPIKIEDRIQAPSKVPVVRAEKNNKTTLLSKYTKRNAPAPVEGELQVIDNNSTAVDLRWNIRGASAFKIYADGKEIGTLEGDKKTVLVHGLTPNALYVFKVKAIDGASTNEVRYLVPDVEFKAVSRAPVGNIGNNRDADGKPYNYAIQYNVGGYQKSNTQLALDDQIAQAKRNFEINPTINGIAIFYDWKFLHPKKDEYNWDHLEQFIAMAAEKGKISTLFVKPGFASPSWIYDEAGVFKLENIGAASGTGDAPVPWDPKFMQLYEKDIRLIAERYADDPRLSGVNIGGAQYMFGEFHSPSVEEMNARGVEVDPQTVYDNWKHWIDLYGELFPNKHLFITVSPMYQNNAHPYMVERLVDYFVTKYQGRAILQNAQLNGRQDFRLTNNMPWIVMSNFRHLAPCTFETLSNFNMKSGETKSNSLRQGSIEMVVLNLKWAGSHYFRYWRDDAITQNGAAEQLQKIWDKYRDMTYHEMKEDLQKNGLYTVYRWQNGDPINGDPYHPPEIILKNEPSRFPPGGPLY